MRDQKNGVGARIFEEVAVGQALGSGGGVTGMRRDELEEERTYIYEKAFASYKSEITYLKLYDLQSPFDCLCQRLRDV